MNYMSAFSSYQNNSFTLDSLFHPNTTPLFSQFYPCEHVDQIPVDICNNINEISENNHVNFTDHSSSVPTNNVPENGTKEQVVTNTKNKIKRKTSSVQLKDRKEVKAGNKRQRKRKISLSEDSTDQGINNKGKSDEKKVLEEAPTGYIHVRARRGQATDSHSLAERVRREKISERMKVLQTLVPGCDKVTGKALMLDEIINYVQSLQHQVEFLSLRLASTNPTVYDFGMDMDALMVNHERLNKLVSPILFSSMEKYNFALPLTLFEETTPHPYPQLFPQGHIITPDQENETGDKELAINLAASSFTNLWPFPLN